MLMPCTEHWHSMGQSRAVVLEGIVAKQVSKVKTNALILLDNIGLLSFVSPILEDGSSDVS